MAHGAFDTVGAMRAGFPLVIYRLMAGGTGIPGWNQPMDYMRGLILLSNGRLDGSSQNEKNEQGGDRTYVRGNYSRADLLSEMSQYRNGNGCRSVMRITSHRNAICALANFCCVSGTSRALSVMRITFQWYAICALAARAGGPDPSSAVAEGPGIERARDMAHWDRSRKHPSLQPFWGRAAVLYENKSNDVVRVGRLENCAGLRMGSLGSRYPTLGARTDTRQGWGTPELAG